MVRKMTRMNIQPQQQKKVFSFAKNGTKSGETNGARSRAARAPITAMPASSIVRP